MRETIREGCEEACGAVVFIVAVAEETKSTEITTKERSERRRTEFISRF
jgi:hypothetical protein